MPEGGQVEVTARNVPFSCADHSRDLLKGRYVEIAIRDSGIGIPEQYISKIFDPYFTTKERGSGLGLATAYSIIRNHNGLITVKSLPGKGTTFFICLPVAEAQNEEPEKKEGKLAAPARSGRVLVMDDEKFVRDVAGELISAFGHEAVFAAHGEETIEIYRAAMRSGKPFDVVILDLTIRGGMGGLDTIQKLLEIDPDAKVVVSSGYSENDVISRYQDHGFCASLKKPYKVTDLQKTLNSLIQ